MKILQDLSKKKDNTGMRNCKISQKKKDNIKTSNIKIFQKKAVNKMSQNIAETDISLFTADSKISQQ